MGHTAPTGVDVMEMEFRWDMAPLALRHTLIGHRQESSIRGAVALYPGAYACGEGWAPVKCKLGSPRI